MGKFGILIFVLICLCVACKPEMVSEEKLTMITGYDGEARDNGTDSGIASFEIVPLETIPESILSEIGRLEITDSLILVQDHARLLGFDKAGKFKRAYGSNGRGSGEYLSLNAFWIDPGGQTLTILDEYLQKLITYRMNGDLLTEKTYPRGAFAMTHSAVRVGQENVLSESYVFNRQNTIYATLNLKTGERKPLYTLPVRTKNMAMPIGRHPVSSFRDTIKLILPFDPRIYSLQDTGLIPLLSIQTQKETVPAKRLEAEEDFSISTYLDICQEGYFLGI